MVLVETLTTTIGTAVAKAVLRLWLGEAAAGEAAAGIADVVSAYVGDFRERRRVVRQFESIAEQIADRLRPFFEHEFASGLPENEQNAAALAVAAALDATNLSLKGVLAHDLDPLKLEATVRARTPDAAARAYLNDAATQLFDFALRESCNYVVEILVTLPRFSEAATREILTREGELSRLVHQVLDQLPSASEQASVAQAQSEQFETQYRREIARKLDRLVLFGLDQADQGQRYALARNVQ